jgi:hypothetical protein
MATSFDELYRPLEVLSVLILIANKLYDNGIKKQA